MWTNSAWPGRSIPTHTPKGGELAAYSALVRAVEGNTTFYALPSREVAQRWAESTPVDFRFMFKFPKAVTHERKLRDCAAEVENFFTVLEPCFDKMHPVAIQLPASFGPESLGVLERFISTQTQRVRFAVEVRHLDFFDGKRNEHALNDMLYRVGADRIMMDTRAVFAGPRVTPAEHEAFENKPRVPVRAVATNNAPILRFIGQTDPAANPEFWAPWVETVARWISDGRSPTVFVHTPDNAAAIDLARQFYDEVRVQVPSLAPQSAAPPVDTPNLFSL